MTTHNEAIDERDVENLAAIRGLYARTDPMPTGLVERMKFAISVHALHAEVAELMDEALLVTRAPDVGELVPTPTESVTFSAPSVSLMVSISPAANPDEVRLDGWVTRGGCEVDVVHSTGTTSLTSDENGRFVVESLPRGAVHFLIRIDPGNPDARPVITPTVQL